MEQRKIQSVIELYRKRFEEVGIQKKRMEPNEFFSSKQQMLEHAHFLLEGILEYSQNPEQRGKTGRHLGSVQTLLWCAEWYTLDEIMNHNRPDIL